MTINQSFKGAATPAILHIPSSIRSSVCRLARLSVLASAAAVAIATSPAYSYTITDLYSGGNNTYNSPNDVIGSNTFNTTDAVLTRSGLNNSILNITINTYYAGAAGTLGTGYGSLFFSTTGWTPTGPVGSSPNRYPEDQYQPNDWNFCFQKAGKSGDWEQAGDPSGLYAVGNVTTQTIMVRPRWWVATRRKWHHHYVECKWRPRDQSPYGQ